jgi:hypothetical protein
MGTSVPALVRRYLTELGAGETEFQRRKRREAELRARVHQVFRGDDNLSRDQVHEPRRLNAALSRYESPTLLDRPCAVGSW